MLCTFRIPLIVYFLFLLFTNAKVLTTRSLPVILKIHVFSPNSLPETNLSGAVNSLDFGSVGWWCESKSSHKTYLGVLPGEQYFRKELNYASHS
jgi:hypothetical protein